MLTQIQAHRKKTWSMFLFQMHSEVMWCHTKELLLWWIFRPLLAVHAPGSECDSDGGMAWGWWLGSSSVVISLIIIIKSMHPYPTMPRYALLYILYNLESEPCFDALWCLHSNVTCHDTSYPYRRMLFSINHHQSLIVRHRFGCTDQICIDHQISFSHI